MCRRQLRGRMPAPAHVGRAWRLGLPLKRARPRLHGFLRPQVRVETIRAAGSFIDELER